MKQAGIVFVWLLALATPAVLAAGNKPKEEPVAADSAKPDKILFVVTSHGQLGNTDRETGFFLSEVAHPHKVLTDSGYVIEFVSPKGGKAPMDGVELDDAISKAFLENPAYKQQIENTMTPDQVNPDEFVAIYYAGGHGTMWDFPDNEKLAELAARMYEDGKVVAAVCHGPAGLVNVKLSDGKYLVAGKKVTSFTNEEEESVGLTTEVPFLLENKLIERGATHTEATVFLPNVIVSDRLVTGQNPASATGVAEEMLKLLRNSDGTPGEQTRK